MTDPQTQAPPRDFRREYREAMRECSPKQRKWLKLTYEKAGQKWSAGKELGYSAHTIWKWMRDEKIKAVIALQQLLAEQDHDITRARILREYERLAFSNLNDFRSVDGRRKQFAAWTDDMSAAVHEVEFDDIGNPTKLKLHDKRGALDTLAKIQGVLIEKTEVSLGDGTPAPVIHLVKRGD